MSRFTDIRKIIIIGGGPAALLAALCLYKKNGIHSSLYELRPEPSSLGGAIGIPANGLRLLHELGLYDEAVTKGALTSKINLHALNGSTLGEIDLASWSEQQTGFGYLRIRRTDLMKILLDAASRENINISYGKRLAGIAEEGYGVTAQFEDGESDTADFLLGCDGIHSAVRRLYVDPGVEPEYTGICNMFSLVPAADVADLRPQLDSLNVTLTANGLFAMSPTVPTQDLIYWFFSREIPMIDSANRRDGWEERAQKFGHKQAVLDILGSETSEWSTFQREIVEKTQSYKFYPIHKLPIGRPWSRGRCLVIGDAAHAMPPHASQGVSMALEDVFLLSKLLKSSAPFTEEGIQQYVAKRKSRTEKMLHTAQSNGSVRKSMAPWRVRLNEVLLLAGLWLYKWVGLQKLGLGQRNVVYDINLEVF